MRSAPTAAKVAAFHKTLRFTRHPMPEADRVEASAGALDKVGDLGKFRP